MDINPNSFELSILEVGDLTGWPQSMVEDYRALHESALELAQNIDTVAANTPPPSAATSTGKAGQIAYDAGFIYVCIADNSWVRAALSAW